MRIKVHSSEHHFTLRLPNVLLLNPVSAAICVKALKNKKYDSLQDHSLLVTNGNDGTITYSAMLKLFSAIRKSRHLLQGQSLVLVNSADGDVVEIWL